MTQLERIYNKIEGNVRFVSQIQNNGRSFGKMYATAIKTGIQYALENQWVTVEEDLPEPGFGNVSDWCMVMFNSRHTLPIPGRYDFSKKEWVDVGGFTIHKVLYWMLIPKLPVVQGEDIYPNLFTNTEP